MNIRRIALTLITTAFIASSALAQDKGSLRIAAIDVEGGQATLFVSSAGQSLLVDTGWAGYDGRDADRIVAAAKGLGLTRIDTVLITHFHSDHVGGVPQLVGRIPVGTFLDHGELYEKSPDTQALYAAYEKAIGNSKHIVVHAGEKLPIAGFDAIAISSDGSVMQKTLSGAGTRDPLCSPMPKLRADETENGHSLGIVIRYGGLRILDAGDLTVDRERGLVCPVNRIGRVDLAIVSHHGSDLSSSKVFVHTLRPRVAIMNNGDHKGGSTSVIDTYRSSPGLETLYQLHLAPAAGTSNPAGTTQEGADHNVADEFIANTAGVEGKRIDVTIHPNGTMDTRNERTGAVKHFARR